jgi:hypothetical protein
MRLPVVPHQGSTWPEKIVIARWKRGLRHNSDTSTVKPLGHEWSKTLC